MNKKLNSSNFSKYRDEILNKFGNIESIIEAVISQHYFSKVRREFLLEVLGDEYFSTGLKIRVLLKVAKKLDCEKELRELVRIRNYFVHLFPKFHDKYLSPTPGELVAIDPRNTSKSVNFELEYKKFVDMENKVVNSLVNIYKEKGGVLVENGFPYQE